MEDKITEKLLIKIENLAATGYINAMKSRKSKEARIFLDIINNVHSQTGGKQYQELDELYKEASVGLKSIKMREVEKKKYVKSLLISHVKSDNEELSENLKNEMNQYIRDLNIKSNDLCKEDTIFHGLYNSASGNRLKKAEKEKLYRLAVTLAQDIEPMELDGNH